MHDVPKIPTENAAIHIFYRNSRILELFLKFLLGFFSYSQLQLQNPSEYFFRSGFSPEIVLWHFSRNLSKNFTRFFFRNFKRCFHRNSCKGIFRSSSRFLLHIFKSASGTLNKASASLRNFLQEFLSIFFHFQKTFQAYSTEFL